MKIRTITCHHVYNHGAYLQAYALIEYLRSLGHDAKIIDYRPSYLTGHFNLISTPENYKKRWLSIPYNIAKLPVRLMALPRKWTFDKFSAKYLTVDTPTYRSVEDLRSNPPQADVYIAGSDQIWNTEFKNGRDAAFYLDFGKPELRRLSYAASFATDKVVSEYVDFVSRELRNFDAISVREESGVAIVEGYGLKAAHVVDPVFLLDVESWSNLASNDGMGDNYILVYDFMGDVAIRTVVQTLAKAYGAKIYSIGPYKMKYTDKDYINYDPTTFVSLIKHARCVVSNSFHASAFSLIFQKNFFVVNRADGLNIRMQNLLSHYGIANRLVNKDATERNLTASIDYSRVATILKHDIERSKFFLKGALENE